MLQRMNITPFVSNAEVPHAPRMAANGWRMLCCPMHIAMMLPMGMGAAPPAAAPSEPPPSFFDGTPQEVSDWVGRSDANTRDLYDVIEAGRLLVIRNATLWPMTDDRPLPAHDLLVRDGVIVGTQPSAATVPEGARVVDATGLHAIPGLADNHVHPVLIGMSNAWSKLLGPGVDGSQLQLPYDLVLFLYLAGGTTRIQVMSGSAEELALRAAVRDGRLRGPAMRVASPVVDGYPVVWGTHITYAVGDTEGAATAARRMKEKGFDFAKPYTRLPLEAYDRLMAECKALGIEVNGHIPAAVRVDHALRSGQSGVAHVIELFSNLPMPERASAEHMTRVARLAAERNVTVCPTLSVSRVFEYDIGQRNDISFSNVLDPMLRYLMRPNGPIVQMFSSQPQFVIQGTDILAHSILMMQALRAEGVRFVSGTDFGNGNVTLEHSLHDELEMYVRDVGMSPLEALRSATVESAAHHGESAVSGTLEVGKRSDLVLLRADPSRDIAATRQIEGVMLGNAYLSRDAMARGLERAKAIYARMPVPAAA